MRAPLLLIVAMAAALFSCGCFAKTDLFLLTNSSRARCLDGTFPGYYFQAGSGEGANKFYVFMEGGYYCYGQTRDDILTQCYQRSFTDLGSSSKWATSFTGEANLSDNVAENPLFYNWNKIMIKYCDGTYYQSSAEPITFNDRQLFFRGNDNMREILQDLAEKRGILSAETVVLAGASAGGQGAYFWSQYLRRMLPESVKMMTNSDCGLNTEVNDYMQRKNPVFVDLVTDGHREIIQPQGCPYLYDNENLYKCFFQEYIIDLVPVPVYFISSLYDAFFLPVYLGVTCIQGNAFVNCSDKDLASIQELRTKLLNLIEVIRLKRPDWGVWAIACIKHVLTQEKVSFNNANYEVPCNSQMTSALALKDFVLAFEKGEHLNQFYYIDSVQYPDNSKCSPLQIRTH